MEHHINEEKRRTDKVTSCPVFELYVASRKLIKIYKKELEKLGLTYPQYLVITCLLQKDGQSVDKIGQELFLDSGTLTPLLKRLEANGFIVRNWSTQDERQRVINLTPKGREFEKVLAPLRHEIRSKLRVSHDEVQQLSQVLHKILSTTV
jgi:MarR family transcriptional regulator, organic hydroperoxide resistance regulator